MRKILTSGRDWHPEPPPTAALSPTLRRPRQWSSNAPAVAQYRCHKWHHRRHVPSIPVDRGETRIEPAPAVTRFAHKPWPGFRSVMRRLIVSATPRDWIGPPAAMATATHARAPCVLYPFNAKRRDAILGVSLTAGAVCFSRNERSGPCLDGGR